jgi:ATP diphosphatase
MSNPSAVTGVTRLLEIMAALRDPQSGCPWDVEQNFASIAPFTIEEAYEVVEAIDRGNMVDLADELGDLLLQVVFHAQMASEAGAFEFDDVVNAICDKMIRRHPHVFGDAVIGNATEQTESWEAIKLAERAARGEVSDGALDGVGRGMPPLLRAQALQKRARRSGFDWDDAGGVLDKLEEEVAELRSAVAIGRDEEVQAELGDVLFTCVNIARHLDVDTQLALTSACRRFETRFRHMETAVPGGQKLVDLNGDEREMLWAQAKRELGS